MSGDIASDTGSAAFDRRGCPITGASPGGLEAFERSLAAFQAWRGAPAVEVRIAVGRDPAFVMAHALAAYLHLCSREPGAAGEAAAVLAQASRLRTNPRERQHLAAIAAMVAGQYERAAEWLALILAEYPRDALALQVAHAGDYLLGNTTALRDRVRAVLPAWSAQVPGYHAVLAMYAFGLEECGDYGAAEEFAFRALELNPDDARAHHAMTHVFEMRGDAEAGARWLEARMPRWAGDTFVATHCWWHLALFHIAAGRRDRALALYDSHVRATRSRAVADMIDASALLWRLQLGGMDVGGRWHELADAWTPHAADGFCAFSDLHAMMAFVAAGRADAARRLLITQVMRIPRGGTNAVMTRLVGLPACRALQAFGRGDYAGAADTLRALPPVARRLGGSHAQRGILEFTAREAMRRAGARPAADRIRREAFPQPSLARAF